MEGHGIRFRYRRHWVLDHLDFQIPERALIIITGNNGGGKTTLLKILAGALEPKAGTLSRAWSDQLERQAYLPAFNLLDTGLTLDTQARQLARVEGFLEKAFRQNCKALSTLAEPNQKLRTLSSGTLRKVNLAAVMALSSKPLLFIDELDELLDEDSLPLLSVLLARQIEAGKTIVATLQHTHWLAGFPVGLHRIALTKTDLAHV